MPSKQTEASGPIAKGFDLLSDVEIAQALAQGQQAALRALNAAIPESLIENELSEFSRL